MLRKTIVIATLLMAATTQVMAQADEEYRFEVGGGIGLVSYLGDFNSSITGSIQPMGTLLLRRVINPYMDVTATLSYGQLKGSTSGMETWYPEYQDHSYSFSNPLVDLSLRYEYNFWPYGTGRDYRGAKRLTPFVMLGLGGTFVKTDEKNVVTANIPIGLGLKYKVGARMNVGLEWAMHFTLSDELDGVKDPYWVESSGAFKNTECYHTLQLTLTYSFMAKCRTCHNEDE